MATSERPGSLSTRPPPPQGSDDEWNAVLMDIVLGLPYETVRARYRISWRRAIVLRDVYRAARANDVVTLNGLRDRWVLEDLADDDDG